MRSRRYYIIIYAFLSHIIALVSFSFLLKSFYAVSNWMWFRKRIQSWKLMHNQRKMNKNLFDSHIRIYEHLLRKICLKILLTLSEFMEGSLTWHINEDKKEIFFRKRINFKFLLWSNKLFIDNLSVWKVAILIFSITSSNESSIDKQSYVTRFADRTNIFITYLF